MCLSPVEESSGVTPHQHEHVVRPDGDYQVRAHAEVIRLDGELPRPLQAVRGGHLEQVVARLSDPWVDRHSGICGHLHLVLEDDGPRPADGQPNGDPGGRRVVNLDGNDVPWRRRLRPGRRGRGAPQRRETATEARTGRR